MNRPTSHTEGSTRHPRRRRRNRLLLVGLLPSLVALAVGLALLLTLQRNDAGLAAYDEGRFGDARADFAGNRWFGVVEPWVAPFNEGDAHYFRGEYESAVEDFRAALLVVPVEYECRVRLNIALARERIGDSAPDPTSARAEQAWRDARDALAAGDCTQRTDVVADPDDLLADPEVDSDADPDVDPDADPDADSAVDPGSDPLDPFDRLDPFDPFDRDVREALALLEDPGSTDDDVTPAVQRALRELALSTDQRLAEKLAEALARRDRQELDELDEEERRERERLEREQQRAAETEAKDPPPPDGAGEDDGSRPVYRW